MFNSLEQLYVFIPRIYVSYKISVLLINYKCLRRVKKVKRPEPDKSTGCCAARMLDGCIFRSFFSVDVNNTARAHAMESARTVVPCGKIIRVKVTQIDLSRVVH